MPYKRISDLPSSVQNVLPKHAQEIYKEAYNHAHEEYSQKEKRKDPKESLEEVCHKVAWAAVKKKYKKGPDGNYREK